MYVENTAKALCLLLLWMQAVGAANTDSALNADDVSMMPHIMAAMNKITKGMPVTVKVVPLIVGTKKEMLTLKKELQLPINLPPDTMNQSDDEIVSVPLTADQISRPLFGLNPGFEVRNGSCGVPIKELVPLMRTYTVSKLVHHSPNLILNMLRILVGPKPDGTKSALTFDKDVSGNLQRLLTLSTSSPLLVHTLGNFDPVFIPNLVSAILGVADEKAEKNEQTGKSGES